jgi:hypothetical protein
MKHIFVIPKIETNVQEYGYDIFIIIPFPVVTISKSHKIEANQRAYSI